MSRNHRKKSFINRLNYKYAALLVPALILLLLITELTGRTHLFHKAQVPPVIPVINSSSDNRAQPSSSSSQPTGASTKDRNEPSKDAAGPSQSLPLYAPFGDFVSNHNPNLGGSPAPSQESSVCNTTPGASCYISLEKGSIRTQLPPRKADAKGTAYWTWDIKKAGLTPGNWTVTAVATQGGQSKSTKDPQLLNINP